MGWVLTPTDSGYELSRTTGHMAEFWGIIVDQEKAMSILEALTWTETLAGSGVIPAPPTLKSPKRRKSSGP